MEQARPPIYEVSIHLKSTENADIDLKDILQITGLDYIHHLTWVLTWVEWLSLESEPFEYATDKEEKILSGEKLAALAAQVYQTIEGNFYGFADPQDAELFKQSTTYHSIKYLFTRTSLQLLIEIRDNTHIAVYLTNPELVERLSQRLTMTVTTLEEN